MSIEDFRKRKIEELNRDKNKSLEEDFVQRQLEQVKNTVLQKILTKEARERLANVRLSNPKLANYVEAAIVEAVQSGQLRDQITEDNLKIILEQAANDRKSFRIIK